MSYPAASPGIEKIANSKKANVRLVVNAHTTAASVTASIKNPQPSGASPALFEAVVANGAGAVTAFVYAVTAGTTIGIGVFDPKATRPISAKGTCVVTAGANNAALGTQCYCVDPTAATSGANGGMASSAGTLTGGAAFMLTFEGSLTTTTATGLEFDINLEWL